MSYKAIFIGFSFIINVSFAHIVSVKTGEFPENTHLKISIYDHPPVALQQNSLQTHQVQYKDYSGLFITYNNPLTKTKKETPCKSALGDISKPSGTSLYLVIRYDLSTGNFRCTEACY